MNSYIGAHSFKQKKTSNTTWEQLDGSSKLQLTARNSLRRYYCIALAAQHATYVCPNLGAASQHIALPEKVLRTLIVLQHVSSTLHRQPGQVSPAYCCEP
jgi:hypothetical protein